MLKTQLDEAVNYIRSKTEAAPKLAIILGSGLGPFAEEIQNGTGISTSSIPNYPPSTVEGHAGKWIFGDIEGKTILAMKGRVHSYEGYPLQKVTFPLQLMAQMGIEKLIVTNAAGGHNPRFTPGDLMLITDHINLMFDNPLIGPNELGPRFPDMCEPYDAELIALAEKAALDLGIKLQKGVLAALKGPTYETAAEVKMLQRLGADAGTMSTVPEVIAAVSRGIKVLGISCITNLGTGMSPEKLSHDEVTEVADMVKDKFSRLIREIISRIG
ncbi:purine-nucleoside phosphorylase [candidate division KSB1 bacterium]|nr:purine-nucleoside phosphorylase [candidate division KSB1 bacterium]